ncbi:hypothetical protein [Polaribacter cellanae]|uniref:S1 motif domain-containing protein n=1 Tax=Polaribacter cellanae TaxID=2818493 RepID=A0A975H6K4_9FLAO|nr:hypothetical protein [Polaribacter cellanae]QTE22093.1 hypothetical protein J3359_14945 [Polaribacter cellanae]
MGKTPENIEYYLNPKNDKDYLQDLLFRVKQSFENQENVVFKIVKTKEKGFSVKVGGLFAFVSFNHFSWSYPSFEFWQNISEHLIGKYFTGRIYKLKEKPILIQIDAKEKVFEKVILKEYYRYKGVILQKTKYGLFVDLGVHFNWKFGSIIGLIHKSTLMNVIDYDNWNAGDKITTLFLGYNEDKQLILGDNIAKGIFFRKQLGGLIGTVQKVNVVINKNGETEYFVFGKYKAIIPIKKEFYPNFRTTAKKYTYELKDGDEIECEIIKINKKRDCFILKLLIEPPSN